MMIPIDPQRLKKLALKYQEGEALTKISDQEGIDWLKLKKLFLKMGLDIRGQEKHSINEDYFKSLDTPEKAYFFGLLMADGTLLKNRNYDIDPGKVIIGLVEDDSYILEEFRKKINLSRELLSVKKEGNRQNQKKLYVANKKFAKNLQNLGMSLRKTYGGGIISIDEKLMPSFILGYFDGDGCFSAWENKEKMERKSLFSITSHKDHLDMIVEFLQKKNIFGSLLPAKGTPVHCLTLNGNLQCAKFFNLIYSQKDQLPTFLQRKYLKAKYFLEKYGAITKLKYDIPERLKCSDFLKWAENNLTGQKLLDFQAEWAEIQSRENIIPSATSSQRFLPNAQNKPV